MIALQRHSATELQTLRYHLNFIDLSRELTRPVIGTTRSRNQSHSESGTFCCSPSIYCTFTPSSFRPFPVKEFSCQIWSWSPFSAISFDCLSFSDTNPAEFQTSVATERRMTRIGLMWGSLPAKEQKKAIVHLQHVGAPKRRASTPGLPLATVMDPKLHPGVSHKTRHALKKYENNLISIMFTVKTH